MDRLNVKTTAATLLLLQLLLVDTGAAQELWRLTRPEQRRLEIRDPSRLRTVRLDPVAVPETVTEPGQEQAVWKLSLDEAIRIALANAEVIRVLAGQNAIASGSTTFDPAIFNAEIDRARARFDPVLQSQNTWGRLELPQAVVTSPGPPLEVEIEGISTDTFQSNTGINKTFITGGNVGFNVNANQVRDNSQLSLLNPETSSSATFIASQPLLQGAGVAVNAAPIVIARIDTERSFFQMKDSVQELVRGVIDAYWNLTFARMDTWARRQQVQQGQQALQQAEARLKIGSANITEVSQARSSFETFRANLISAQANLLQQESVLRNLMRLPPSDRRHIEPITPPRADRLDVNWEEMLITAERYRPDLIELKLIIEADEQRLLISRNGALPRLDAVALYRWNGLEGRTPSGMFIQNENGFTDWELGVNFSVPLGLRAERATLRQQELILTRDRANLEQGVHNMTHVLATNYRNLAQYYEQYLAFQRVREAAQANLERQFAVYGIGGIDPGGGTTIFLNLLQSITDWGNAASAESQYLSLYNTELANIEREMGIILESHGVRFVEERYRSIGPLGRHFEGVCYPRSSEPGPNDPLYPIATPQLPAPPIETDDVPTVRTDQEALYSPATVRPLPPVEELPGPTSMLPSGTLLDARNVPVIRTGVHR